MLVGAGMLWTLPLPPLPTAQDLPLQPLPTAQDLWALQAPQQRVFPEMRREVFLETRWEAPWMYMRLDGSVYHPSGCGHVEERGHT